MNSILAIDPGTTESAYLLWSCYSGPVKHGFVPNEHLGMLLRSDALQADFCAIEMVACYGMPVGKEVFETARWVGIFQEAMSMESELVYRKDIKLHLCGSPRAKDGNVRKALIDKHGAPGTKKAPGKLYGISGHLWAALAVADYAADKRSTATAA